MLRRSSPCTRSWQGKGKAIWGSLHWHSLAYDDKWSQFELVAVSRILRNQFSPLKPDTYVVREEEARIASLIGVPSTDYFVIVGPQLGQVVTRAQRGTGAPWSGDIYCGRKH